MTDYVRVYSHPELATHGADAEAADLLRDSFGSRCDEDYPEPYDRGAAWQSRCLRHEPEYRDAAGTIDERE